MAEEGTDAKGQGDAQTAPAGVSSPPATDPDGLVPTVEGIPTMVDPDSGAAPPGGAKPEGKEEGKEEPKAEGKEEGDKKGAEEDTPFHEHPRFTQLNDRMKTAESRNTQLEGEIRSLKEKPSGDAPAKRKQGELPFKDTSEMKPEELIEWQNEDPHGYRKNLVAEAEYNIERKMDGKLAREREDTAVESTYEGFAKDNPEFDEMWDRGEIQRFMEKNLGHNAISAYLVLTKDKTVKDAKAEAEKEIQDNLRAKRESQVLTSGPSAAAAATAANQPDPELLDTKKHGGLTSVLAKRSEERQKKRGW